jgi:hypothetical protein
VSYELAERDLAHIRDVLTHLEREAEMARVDRAGKGIGLNYWRSRILEDLAVPLLPVHLEKQARELLVRLDRLQHAERCS